ncbi:MAG TPA: hypothetical protein VNR64_04355 [Vicinamibacterales bacterium]|nr:hypothetical protein [Vicinamibacterales bacterium]
MMPDPGQDLFATDEILQVMFWMLGEGLAPDVDALAIARFLPFDVDRIDQLLNVLVGRGFVRAASAAPGGGLRFALTDLGRLEAGRRFADEFADMTKPGHGECADADCDCHRTGSAADCRHKYGAVE